MNKTRTNPLDALRALIAERQQYEQWLATLESRRDTTAEHVFERVQGDYRGRLDRVMTQMKGHSEELQQTISELSSRLVEVAREEDVRRETLQEAELRAAVGEYEPAQWETIRIESSEELERIAAERESLDTQLSELRGIQKLSQLPPGSAGASAGQIASPTAPPVPQPTPVPPATLRGPDDGSAASRRDQSSAAQSPAGPAAVADRPAMASASAAPLSGAPASAAVTPPEPAPDTEREDVPGVAAIADAGPRAADSAPPRGDQRKLSLGAAQAGAAPVSPTPAAAPPERPRGGRTPPGSTRAVRSARGADASSDKAKTLKCPECGTANYPTEWYCERCGGELATM